MEMGMEMEMEKQLGLLGLGTECTAPQGGEGTERCLPSKERLVLKLTSYDLHRRVKNHGTLHFALARHNWLLFSSLFFVTLPLSSTSFLFSCNGPLANPSDDRGYIGTSKPYGL
jgi:hypothetical protein